MKLGNLYSWGQFLVLAAPKRGKSSSERANWMSALQHERSIVIICGTNRSPFGREEWLNVLISRDRLMKRRVRFGAVCDYYTTPLPYVTDREQDGRGMWRTQHVTDATRSRGRQLTCDVGCSFAMRQRDHGKQTTNENMPKWDWKASNLGG